MKILKKYLAISHNTQIKILLIWLLIFQGCDITSSPEKLFSKANAERSQNNFKKALKLKSDYSEAYNNYGNTLLKKNGYNNVNTKFLKNLVLKNRIKVNLKNDNLYKIRFK